MNADTFKKLAEIVSERGYIIDFDTKKHMIEICAEFDDDGQINFDDDQHWTIFVGDKCYIDEEITRAMLRKADYIEESNGNGWSFYIGRNCSEEMLDSAFEHTLGWALNCAAEFGELTNAQLDEIEAAGVELEFAARNREWNAEEAAKGENAEQSEDSDHSEDGEQDVEAAPGFGTTYTISVNEHHYRTDDNVMGVWDVRAEAVRELARIQARYANAEKDASIRLLRNGVEIMRANEQDNFEIEDCELNPRLTKKEVRENFKVWGGSLKIWNGSTWTFGNDADWKHAQFIQLIDADGGGEHWRSPRLSGEDYAHFTLMMAAEMKLKRQTVVLS